MTPCKNAIIIESRFSKKVSRDMNFIAQTAYLGICQGFHEKMIDDTIRGIRNMSGISHKQKQREIKRMYEYDDFIINASNVSKETRKLLSSFNSYINDDDLKKVWLVTDRFLIDYMLKSTFIVALSSFSLIADELGSFSDALNYDDLQRKLYLMSNTVSDEYYDIREEKALKNGGVYDRFVFQFFEDSELKKAEVAGEAFLSIFGSRSSFEKYAEEHLLSLDTEQKEYFTKLFNVIDKK